MGRVKASWAYRKKLLNEAKRLHDKNDHQGLVDKLDEILETFPEEDGVYSWRGEALLELGRYEEALSSLQASTVLLHDPETRILIADVLHKLGRAEESLDYVMQVLEDFPADVDLNRRAAKSLLDLERFNEAVALAQKALALNPMNAELWILKGSIEIKAELLEDAYVSLDKALRIEPDNINAVLLYSDLCFLDGDHHGQLRYLERALVLSPDNDLLILQKVLAEIMLGYHEDALRGLDKLKGVETGMPLGMMRITCLMGLRDHEGALAECDRLLSEDDGDSAAWERKGEVLVQMDRYHEAYECFEKSIDINPDSFTGLYDHAISAFKSHHMEKSIPLLHKALEQYPTDPDLLYHLALALEFRDLHDDCIDVCERSLSLKDDPDIRAIKARTLQKKGLSEDALQECVILLEQEPDEPQHLMIAGDALSSMGRKDEAVARYKQALELSPDSIDIMLRLGDVTGDDSWFNKALDKCDELMAEPDDDHSYTLFLKADVLRRLGLEDEAEKAEDMALEVIERLYED